ncbi:MAG: X-Pro dipeptidyl-peptidase [Chloroflexi bacterium]|nr:MAG: X-Pro dipeptidyl-peptidase [Chloroflexota bacterium]
MDSKSKISLAGLGVVGVGLTLSYLFRKKIWERVFKLTPANYQVKVEKNLRLLMPDGVELATDVYRPQSNQPLPTILLRTPYGRGGTIGLPMVFISNRFAERGYNVVCQDVRGIHGSGGEFKPFVYEKMDGQATLEWIDTQPWSDGKVGMWGPSYLGYVQYAAAATGHTQLKALVPLVTQSNMVDLADNGHALDTIMRWMYIIDAMSTPGLPVWERVNRVMRCEVQDKALAPGCYHLPLDTVDEVVLGKTVQFYQDWITHFHHEDDSYFQKVDLKQTIAKMPQAVHFMGGWYDLFLPGLLRDYAAQKAAGGSPYLTIHKWGHYDLAQQAGTVCEALAWFDHHLKGKTNGLPLKPVNVWVMGADEWRGFDHWPPPSQETAYYLQGDGMGNGDGDTLSAGRLSPINPPMFDEPDQYRFDPADPTPNFAGALLSTAAGMVDNRELEARHDVLVFTSPPLLNPLEIIGPVRAVLYVQSSSPFTDFFARLCVVEENGRSGKRTPGRSLNLCDGLLRLEPGIGERQPDGSLRIEIDMSATAYRFQPGQRIRLQVSSGTHPRIGRNLGTGEPILTSTRMVVQEQTVLHDGKRPSALFLPVFEGRG